MVKLSYFCQAVLNASYKAAEIARTIRKEHSLFELLVQEKKNDQKNCLANQDFKTLGDVLIQETIKHDLNAQFPGFCERIFGEESNHFTNTLGETIVVEVKDDVEKTTALLVKVLDGNHEASRLLAVAVHTDIRGESISDLCDLKQEVDVNDIGLWIDPIDSTSQYIKGYEDKTAKYGIHPCGLQCVTVLIGAFSMVTGKPFFGIVNQPFFEQDSTTKVWKGRCSWGLVYQDVSLNSLNKNVSSTEDNDKLIISWQEPKENLEKLSKNHSLCSTRGAGYKLLCVAEQHAIAYPATLGGTYRWDTCGPQALLGSMGGGLLSLDKALANMKGKNLDDVFSKPGLPEDLKDCELVYHVPNEGEKSAVQRWCNTGGLIAYSNCTALKDVLEIYLK